MIPTASIATWFHIHFTFDALKAFVDRYWFHGSVDVNTYTLNLKWKMSPSLTI